MVRWAEGALSPSATRLQPLKALLFLRAMPPKPRGATVSARTSTKPKAQVSPKSKSKASSKAGGRAARPEVFGPDARAVDLAQLLRGLNVLATSRPSPSKAPAASSGRGAGSKAEAQAVKVAVAAVAVAVKGDGKTAASKAAGRKAAMARSAGPHGVEGISRNDLRRLARRGGVERTATMIYDEARAFLRVFLHQVVGDATVYTDHGKRKVVSSEDIILSLKRRGRILYGR